MRPTSEIEQRERLLPAVTAAVHASGYRECTVAQIVAHAHVSRKTFYRLFADKQDCFLAAHRAFAAQLCAEVRDAVAAAAPSQAAQSATAALVGYAEREPAAFTLLTHEAMLAGRGGWRAREALIARLEEPVQEAFARARPADTLPDLPVKMILGAAVRLSGINMRRPDPQLAPMQAGLMAWLDIYRVPKHARKWEQLRPEPTLCEPAYTVVAAAPAPLPRGRHRQPARVAKQLQRERLLHASAVVVYAKGDTDVSVAEIVRSAGVSREVFYGHFHNKEEALLAAQAFASEQLLGTTAGTYFAATIPWPERVWETGRVFTQTLVSVPEQTYLGFVETYALGKAGVKRTDDSVLTFFTVLLEEGRRQRPAAQDVTPLTCEAIYTAVFEVITHYVIAGRAAEGPGLLPVVDHLVLTPFIGAAQAAELITRKLGEAAEGDGDS
jgi:AcrR family transcriptional regulator